jgi:hypothetical protein
MNALVRMLMLLGVLLVPLLASRLMAEPSPLDSGGSSLATTLRLRS